MVKWQSRVTPKFLTESDKGTDVPPTFIVWERKKERPGLSTRGYDHCFSLFVIKFKFVQCHPGFNVIDTFCIERKRSGT